MNDGRRDGKIRAYWEDPSVESMYDRYLADLEMKLLARHVTPEDSVLDLGCGDGSGSRLVRETARDYVGLDRSGALLKKISRREPGIRLIQGDIRNIPLVFSKASPFDVVITQRSIINLPDAESQREVLFKMPDLLRPGGKLLLCEGFKEGLANLNRLRVDQGCKPIAEKWHNIFLERSITAETLAKTMELSGEEDLSWYYFLTRVFHQALVGNGIPEWDSPVNQTAHRLALGHNLPPLFGYSTILLQIWKKRK